MGLKPAQTVYISCGDPGTLGWHVLMTSTTAMQFIVWDICKPNTGQISSINCVHKTSVKVISVAVELIGAPEDQAQLTIKYLRTQGIVTNVWGASQDCVLCGLEMLGVTSTGPSCKTGTDCPASHWDPFQHRKQAGPWEHSGSSLFPITRSFLQLLSARVWVGFSASILLDTDVY